tara:strand:- start:548 stop:961 length:414 start_codon:yes stop_codon:yes gene_type:complete
MSKSSKYKKSDKSFTKVNSKKNYKKNSKKRNFVKKPRRNRNNYDNGEVTKVKMSYLPHDISYRQLRDLIQKDEWGKVGSININTYEQDKYRDKVTVAYIDFYVESEAEYFIKAINGTKNIDPNYPVFLEVTKLKRRY